MPNSSTFQDSIWFTNRETIQTTDFPTFMRTVKFSNKTAVDFSF
jgi:hypothetical protein